MKVVLAVVSSLSIGFTVGSVSAVGRSFAQLVSPAAVNGCVYLSTPPSLSDKQTVAFQCDSSGKLITH